MRAWTTLALATVATAWLAQSGSAFAGAAECAARSNDTQQKLLECVTLEEVRRHQRALQHIASISGGNRYAGLQGHKRSLDYVGGLMRAAGYAVTVQWLDYLASTSVGPSVLQQKAPRAVTYVEGTDFIVADQSDPGDVTARVTAVDLQLGPGNRSTSGCEQADFARFPAGNVALIQRGGCDFRAKAENASAAGAVGAVIFNQGDTEANKAAMFVSLLPEYAGGIPVVFTSYPLGVQWSATPNVRLRLFANVTRRSLRTANLLAETRGGRADRVVMVGAHLDSVFAGPGINDNGSGSAAILETALQMKKGSPRNKVRFVWWTAEESGVVGAQHYVDHLTRAERGRIALYLNFDMLGSPNPGRFVYDGDGSTFGDSGPPGSGEIESYLLRYFAQRNLRTAPITMLALSDHGPFLDAGIPSGGVFTGADEIKSKAEAALFGGTAGKPYDPCYHKACDDIRNVDLRLLGTNADAVAAATLHFAMKSAPLDGSKAAGGIAVEAGRSGERRGPLIVR